MTEKYLSNPDYNFEKINRASSACGPMVKWCIAQARGKHDFFNSFHIFQASSCSRCKTVFQNLKLWNL